MYSTGSAVGARVTNPDGSADCAGAGCVGGDLLLYSLPDVWAAGARVLLTDRIDLSAWGRLVTYGGYGRDDPAQLGRVLRLSGDAVTRGAAPKQIIFDHGLLPQFIGEFGVRWLLVPQLRVAGSLITTTSAVSTASLDAAAFDAPKIDLTVGAEWRVARWLRLVAAYGFTFFIPSDPTPGAFDPRRTVRCVDSRYDADLCNDVVYGRGLPTASAAYGMTQHHFALGALIDFF